jgi:hypothetical protein
VALALVGNVTKLEFMNMKLLFRLFTTLLALPASAIAAVILSDGFEYPVARDGTCENFTTEGSWQYVKSINCTGSSRGYLYTVDAIPGYSGAFPGNSSSRVLAIEALPETLGGQTDFYLQAGAATDAIGTIPANLWVQFWVYSNNTEAQPSRYIAGKYQYYNRATYYPATLDNDGYVYLFNLVETSKAPLIVDACPGVLPCESAYFVVTFDTSAGGVDSKTADQPENFGPNLSSATHVRPNQWMLIKYHIDFSGTDPRAAAGHAVYEMWIRPLGVTEWTKTAEYFGGVTQVNGQTVQMATEFTDGLRMMRMPSTVGSPSTNWADSWMYVDDYVMATSEASLPVYSNGATLPAPSGFRIY